MELYVGTSGYSYPAWKGSFYPDRISPKKMLPFYAERFRTVESNFPFRGTFKASHAEAWAGSVPEGFRFILKAPQAITHFKRLKGAGELVTQFVEAAAPLTDRLGPLLFQLPESFKKDAARLRDFLAELPTTVRSAFEFRHASWFDDEVFGLLRDHRASLCLADADGHLDVPFVSTADWGYLRLRKAEYDRSDLQQWADRVAEQGWRDAYVFFKHEDEGKGPKFAQQYLELAARA